MHTKFKSKNLKGRGNFKDEDVDGRIVLKSILIKYVKRM
jgi:hypothetical protein